MKTLLCGLLPALLAGRAGPDVQQYQALQPALDLAACFNGTSDAWGMFRRRACAP